FFQAEDGIRDGHVTGVRRVLFRSSALGGAMAGSYGRVPDLVDGQLAPTAPAASITAAAAEHAGARHRAAERGLPRARLLRDGRRSEERRVGRGCGSWWWARRVKQR